MNKRFVPIFCSALFVIALLSACETRKTANFPPDAYVDADPEAPVTVVPTPATEPEIIVPQTEIPVVKTEPEKQTVEIVDVKPVTTVTTTPKTTTPAAENNVTYKVRKNDSLWSIGMTYGVSVDALAKANNLDKNKPLQINQTLVIPDAKNAVNKPLPKASTTKTTTTKSSTTKSTTAAKPATNIKPKAGEQLYVVKAGDSLSVIAARFHVKTNELAKANNINDKNTIRVGQTLLIPAATVTSTSSSAKSSGTATAKTTDTAPAKTTEKSKEPTPVSTDVKPAAEPAKTTTPVAAEPVVDIDLHTLPISLEKTMTVDEFTSLYGVSKAELQKLNPSLDLASPIPANAQVIIPLNF